VLALLPRGLRGHSSAIGNREEVRARRDQARVAQLEAAATLSTASAEGRRAALSDQLQGPAAGLDMAPERRPRCAYRPINQLVREEPEEE